MTELKLIKIKRPVVIPLRFDDCIPVSLYVYTVTGRSVAVECGSSIECQKQCRIGNACCFNGMGLKELNECTIAVYDAWDNERVHAWHIGIVNYGNNKLIPKSEWSEEVLEKLYPYTRTVDRLRRVDDEEADWVFIDGTIQNNDRMGDRDDPDTYEGDDDD